MDISILSKTTIKIRARHASIIVDPSAECPKVSSDAVILLNNENVDLSRIVDYRIVINGPGEYEISGVKVLGVRGDKGFVYGFSADGLSVILGRSSDISKISAIGGSASGRKEEINSECQIAILNADEEVNSSVVTKFEPKIVILYGDNKEIAAKLLGKENLPLIKKFTVAKDKLPEEMEVVVLG